MAEEKRKNMTIIYVRRVLEDYSDEEHHLTQNAIGEYIEMEYGVKPERKSIGRSLTTLRDDFGLDIKSDRKGSWLASRTFDDVEIRLLIDSVMGNRYIPEEDSIRIVEKLEDQATVFFNSQSRNIYVLDDKKKINISGLFENIEIVGKAIEDKKAVEFEYAHRNAVLRCVWHRPEAHRETIFPLCIIFIKHKYYVVSRHVRDEVDETFKGKMAYVSLNDIEKLEIVDVKESFEPLSDSERTELKQMLKGEKLQQGRRRKIRFIAPLTLAPAIDAAFGDDVEKINGIHGGDDNYSKFLPDLTKCLYEVNSDYMAFMEFYRKHLFLIKVLSPKFIKRRIDAELTRALKNNGE